MFLMLWWKPLLITIHFYMPVWIGPNTYIENSIAHLCPDITTTYLVQGQKTSLDAHLQKIIRFT